MKLKKISICGLTEAFPNPVSVDFEGLGSGLIALVGNNGVGKSTLIGSIFAALFRQLPGQKRSLYDFCTHPHPEIDLTFSVGGESYRSLLKIDPKARQMESYLFDGRGIPLANGRKEAFQEEIRKRVGTVELFLASIYSSQSRAGNFLGLERSERKQLFITQLLGLSRLRLISATARGFAEQADRQVLTLEGERKGISQLLATESDIESVEELAGQLKTVSTELESAERVRRMAEGTLNELLRRDVEQKTMESRRAELSAQLRRTGTSITTLERQLDEDGRELAGRKDTGDVTAELRGLDARIEEVHRQMEEAKEVETSNREIEATIRSIEADLKAKRDELARSEQESEELAAVPCGGKGPYAGCVKIRRAIQARESLAELGGIIATLQLELELQRSSLMKVPADTNRLMNELQQRQGQRRSLEDARRRQEELKVIEARRQERARGLERLMEEKSGQERQLKELYRSMEGIQGVDADLARVNRELQETASEIKRLSGRREQIIARQAQAEQRLRQIEEARARAARLETELDTARSERDEFDYLAKVFGPDEIQLCEIQAAGPGISAIVNDLLEGCFDNKFEVRFRTQRPRADGKGMVDDFDIEVRNKGLDRTCLVDELSGGQFVLVNEAVNLGIAIYNMRQAEGVRHETLFRDETVGALDSNNAKEYVRMLRRAMEVGGFHQVIFICHSPQVWEMADRLLRIRDGQVMPELEVREENNAA